MACSRPLLDPVEALGGALAGEEGLVVGIHLIGQEVGRLGVGARQDQGGDTHDVGRQTRGDQLLHRLAGGHQDLAAHVAALLHGGELVLEVHPGGAGGDHVLHQLIGIEHAAKAGLGVRDDGQEVVDVALVAGADAAGPLDLVGTLEGVVDAPDHGRDRVVGVERLVGVHGLGGVAVGGDLPAGEIDGLDPGLGLLQGLTAGDGAHAVHIALLGPAADQVPQLGRAALGVGVLGLDAAAQAHHVSGAVAALHIGPAGVLGPLALQGGDLLCSVHGVVSSVVVRQKGMRRLPAHSGRRPWVASTAPVALCLWSRDSRDRPRFDKAITSILFIEERAGPRCGTTRCRGRGARQPTRRRQ